MRGRRCVVLLAFVPLLVFPTLRADAQTRDSSQPQSDSVATWTDRAEEIAEILKRADVIRIEDIGTGVTNPKRAYLAPGGPASLLGTWNLQLIRAKMFDNLIYNLDPNLGNWLVDPSWNIFLIDHSRAFTAGNALAHELTRVDRDLWDRMLQLDEARLTAALGAWLNEREIRAILERRDLMEQTIHELVAAQGDANVFVRETAPGTEAVRPAVDSPTRELVRRAEGAVQTPAFLPPASALLWTGQVVVLSEYAGEHAAIAQRGVERGHSLGLLTNERLAYLAPDPRNGEPLAALSQLVGQRVEVFGPATTAEGAIVVQVMRSRPVP